MRPTEQPERLSRMAAQRHIAALAAHSESILVLNHCRARLLQRGIGRRRVDVCLLRGVVTTEPILNQHGHWQVEIFRHAAGEQLTLVVAIDWPSRLLIITAYERG